MASGAKGHLAEILRRGGDPARKHRGRHPHLHFLAVFIFFPCKETGGCSCSGRIGRLLPFGHLSVFGFSSKKDFPQGPSSLTHEEPQQGAQRKDKDIFPLESTLDLYATHSTTRRTADSRRLTHRRLNGEQRGERGRLAAPTTTTLTTPTTPTPSTKDIDGT